MHQSAFVFRFVGADQTQVLFLVQAAVFHAFAQKIIGKSNHKARVLCVLHGAADFLAQLRG